MRWARPVAYMGEKYICSMEILKERDGSVELGLKGWIIIQ
jgi:hypothetical protein